MAKDLQLQFAYAAGIITLLTVQDTKKETVRITAKRMIIFVIMRMITITRFLTSKKTLSQQGDARP